LEHADTKPGVLIGDRYLLERPVGRGGAAAIWAARDTVEHGIVAVKLLHPMYRSNTMARDRFAREGQVLATLRHPNIATVTEVELARAQPYIVMELIDGTSLEDELGLRSVADDHFPASEISAIVAQLCTALDHAHGLGVVHRDLKPSNVMIASNGLVKVLDFGLAKILHEASVDETTQGRTVGSLAYMAPEQVVSAGVDGRADLYALGIVAYEMLTLRRAWFRSDEGRPLRAYGEPVRPNAHNALPSLARRLGLTLPPPPTEVRQDLPAIVDRIFATALALDPTDRFDDGSAFLSALQSGLRALPGGSVVPAELDGTDNGLTPVMPVDPFQDATPVSPDSLDTGLTPVSGSGPSTALTPVSPPFSSTALTPVSSAGSSTGLTPVSGPGDDTGLTPVSLSEARTGLTPVNGPSDDTGLTPVADSRGGTPVRHSETPSGPVPLGPITSGGEVPSRAPVRMISAPPPREATIVPSADRVVRAIAWSVVFVAIIIIVVSLARLAARGPEPVTSTEMTQKKRRALPDFRGVPAPEDPAKAKVREATVRSDGDPGVRTSDRPGAGPSARGRRGAPGGRSADLSRAAGARRPPAREDPAAAGRAARSPGSKAVSARRGARPASGSRAAAGPGAGPTKDAPPPIDFAALRSRLATVRKAPDDLDAVTRLGDAIGAAAGRLEDAAAGRRVRRIASSSALVGDVEGLARALDELERAAQ